MAFHLEKQTLDNTYYRVVKYTTKYQQLVIMCVHDFIPKEIHQNTDQFIKIEKGNAQIIIDDNIYNLSSGDSITIPSNTWHKITNTSNTHPIKLYTIYSPPHHPPNTLQKTRPDYD